MDCSKPGSSVQWSFQARILEWVAISFSRGSSQPRDHTYVSCLAGRFLTNEPPEKLWSYHYKLSFSEFGPYWELILVSSRKYQLHHGWHWVGELQLRWAVIKEAVYISTRLLPAPSLGYYLSFGWVCKAAGPLGESLNAIGKGALSDESSSMGAWLSV